jgi:endonuclease
MPIYDKPVKFIFKEMIKNLNVQKGDILKREQFMSWFQKNYSKIKDATVSAHMLKMSTNAPSRIHYNVNPNGEDDLLYQIDTQTFRLYDSSLDPAPIYKKNGPIKLPPPIEPIDEGETSEFAYEKDLQNYLAKNLNKIENGLKLYDDEGIPGLEYPVGNRFVDILALDSQNNFVVIELKVSRGYDRVIGQILRYIAWIKKNRAEDNQSVRGIIIGREISEDLQLACSQVPGIDLYEYQLSVSLKKI